MTVYLGLDGCVELQRVSDVSNKTSVVDPADVNPSRKRFSFDFEPGFLITGDQVELTSTTGVPLDFVTGDGWYDGTVRSSGAWYVSIDDLNGVRLFKSFADALSGDVTSAIQLATPAASIPITVQVRNTFGNALGQIRSYELNTNRETVDSTALSDEFRHQYSSLMSGSGQFTALWDYLEDAAVAGTQEAPHYLLQLAVRTEIGSKFKAQLYLKTNASRGDGCSTRDDTIWYEIEGIITGAAVRFDTESVVQVIADFVTTGPIRIKASVTAEDKLLQEDYGGINLDQDGNAFLLLDAPN